MGVTSDPLCTSREVTPYLQVVKASRDLATFRILGPLHTSVTVQTRNFKFGMQIDHEGFLRKKIKLGQRRS